LVINVHEVDNPVIKAFVSTCSTNGFDTSGFIRKLAASGEICRVLGFHCWEYLPSNENVFSLPGQEKRHKCRICGKVETKTEVWK